MLAKEIGARRITVNAFPPGPIDTPFFHGQETERSAAFAAGLAVEGRLGPVSDEEAARANGRLSASPPDLTTGRNREGAGRAG